MRITIQDKDRKAEVECEAVTIHEVIDEVCNLLLAWGFHPDSVKNGIIEKAEEYENDESKKEIT